MVANRFSCKVGRGNIYSRFRNSYGWTGQKCKPRIMVMLNGASLWSGAKAAQCCIGLWVRYRYRSERSRWRGSGRDRYKVVYSREQLELDWGSLV